MGPEDIGKTTLVNALLGWDILPQATDCDSFPTKDIIEVPWGDGHILMDSPGYTADRGICHPGLQEAISRADVLLVMPGMGSAEERKTEARFLKTLLSGHPEKPLFFAIPYDADDWPEGNAPLIAARVEALWHYLQLSHRPDRFFCVDALAGLVAAIEDDEDALRVSGIAKLRSALKNAKT